MSEPRDWDEAHDQLEELRLSAERSGAAPEDWGVTKAEVAALSRRVAQADRAASIAAYRDANPEYRGSDAKMWALMQIEAIGKPSGAATAAHSAEANRA